VRRDAGATVLEVSDDGVGFEPAHVRANPAHGHFGLRVLGDLAREAGADLRVASAPGQGTRWYLRVPDPSSAAGATTRSRYALSYARHADGPDDPAGDGSDDGEGLLAHAFAHQAAEHAARQAARQAAHQTAEDALQPDVGAIRFLSRPGRLLGTGDVTRHRPGRP
jgi:hypothetical protein